MSTPSPSASILLVSPTNQVLLLHRVQTSSAFPSAHVFPGGNLSAFHESSIPDPTSPARHVDGPQYRLAAIRETFEESGILLARRRGSRRGLLDVPESEKHRGRKAIHAETVRFPDWVQGLGGEPDVDSLIPFTRWITPPNVPKRFTTQMYLYLLPLLTEETLFADLSRLSTLAVATDDGGIENTAATFADVPEWLERARRDDIILFPPQLYLLTLAGRFLTGPPPGDGGYDAAHFRRQREGLVEFLASGEEAGPIAWGEKVISPVTEHVLGDGRLILGLGEPGPELEGSERGGDADRVVVLKFAKGGPRRVRVLSRGEAKALVEQDEKSDRDASGSGQAKL